MADKEHNSLTTSSIHVASFVQDTDPGAVGAGKMWIDTSLGTGKYILKARNSTNTGWEEAYGNQRKNRIGVARAKQNAEVYFTTTFKTVDYQDVLYDPDSTITTGSSWKWTAPFDCIAFVAASFAVKSNIECFAWWRVNASNKNYRQLPRMSNWNCRYLAFHWACDEDDYIDLQCKTASGGYNSRDSWNYIDIFWIERTADG